ncbi:MAG TPA: hypothetical protein VHL54_13725, partial [Actinomycetota bacterium]|nr:hypothetical protein [Actinomycetota bacterium]
SEDNAGEASKQLTRSFTVDAVAPKLEVIASTGGNPTVEVLFSESVSCDGLGPSGFDAELQGRRAQVVGIGCAGMASEVLHLHLAEPVRGGDRVSLTVRDRSGAPADVAGNPPAAETRSVEAANTAPALLLAGTSDDPVAAARVSYAGTAVDPDGVVEGIEVSVDGSSFSSAGVDCTGCGRPGEAGWSFEPRTELAHGEHTLVFRSEDNAGDPSAPRSVAVMVDSTRPSLGEVTAVGGSATVELRFSEDLACAGNPAAQFRARIDGRRTGVASAVCEGSTARLELSRAPAGGERVDVTVRPASRRAPGLTDAAGNPVETSSGSAVAVNTAPVVKLTRPAADFYEPRPPRQKIVVEGTASDPDGVVETLEASLDSGAFTDDRVSCRGCRRSGEVTFTVELDQTVLTGIHTLSVRAGDGGETMSEPVVLKLANDLEAPVLKSVAARPGSSTVRAGFSERLDCSTVDAADFRVLVDDAYRPVVAVRCTAPADEDIDLTISGRVEDGDAVSVETRAELADESANLVADGGRRRTRA